MSVFGGPSYDAEKMFAALDELEKAQAMAIAQVRERLPYSECYRCHGKGRFSRNIGEAALGVAFGKDCPDCLGTGVDVWVPFDMDSHVWVRLVLGRLDAEEALPENVRVLMSAFLDSLSAWDHELQKDAPDEVVASG